MTNQTAAEQRKSLVERFEKMTGETVPSYATNLDILAWIRDELSERARDAQRREHARQVLATREAKGRREMTTKQIQTTIRQMLRDWDALTGEQRAVALAMAASMRMRALSADEMGEVEARWPNLAANLR